MKKKEIEKVAKDSYQIYFHEKDTKPQHENSSQDVVLNKDKLTQDINIKKSKEKKRHKSLEVLREKITEEAEKSFDNVFSETKIISHSHKKNTTEMYEELNNEKKHLSEMATGLKEKQISKMKH